MKHLISDKLDRFTSLLLKLKSRFTLKVTACFLFLLCISIIFFAPIGNNNQVSLKYTGRNTNAKSSVTNNVTHAKNLNSGTANSQVSHDESGTSPANSSNNSTTTAKTGNVLFPLSSRINSGKLVFSTSSYTIGTATQSSTPISFTIATSSGVKILTPTATANSDIVFETPFSSPTMIGFQNQYDAGFVRAYPSAHGQAEETISAKGQDGLTYTGQILVIYPSQPYLSVNQGSLSCSNNGTSTTYSAAYTLVPNGNIGNPTLRMSMGSDVGYIGGNFNEVTQYNGQNNYTLTAIISDNELSALSISGTTGFNFTVNVAADGIAGGGWMHYWATVQC